MYIEVTGGEIQSFSPRLEICVCWAVCLDWVCRVFVFVWDVTIVLTSRPITSLYLLLHCWPLHPSQCKSEERPAEVTREVRPPDTCRDCSHLVLVLLRGCSLHVVLSTGVRHADHWADLAADLPLTVLTEMLMTTAGLANADTNTATLLLPLLRYGEQPMAELSASWPPPPSQSGPGKMRDIPSEWSPLLC